MFSVCNKTIDFVGDESLFYQRLNAVYQLECDSNFMIYIDHFTDSSIKDILTELLQLSDYKSQSLPTCLIHAINNSEILTVKILHIQAPITYLTPKGLLRIVLSEKYNLIRSLRAHYPYGLNDLRHASIFGVPSERALAKKLITTLHNEGDEYYSTTKPRFKAVYQYNKDTGEFIKGYRSITEAAIKINIMCAAISNCCAGRTKSAGGYLWSYNKVDKVDTKTYKSAEATPLGWLSPEERVKEVQQRIKQYTKLFNHAEEN